jgi:hypothetical protein
MSVSSKRTSAPLTTVSAQQLSLRATEQGGPVRVGFFEVLRDRPGIGYDFITVQQDRHPALARHRNGVLFDKAPGYRLGGETFVCERQLGPPAIRAEPAIRLGAGEVKQLHWMRLIRKSQAVSQNEGERDKDKTFNCGVRGYSRSEGVPFSAGSFNFRPLGVKKCPKFQQST